MQFKDLVIAAHDHSSHEELLEAMQWWYDHSPDSLKEKAKECFEKLAYKITPEEAEEIVHNMKPKGQYWTHKQIREYLESKGIHQGCVDYYLVMNMAYNDYYNTAKTFGLQNDVEFYYGLAKDFIEDPDASPFKVAKYFKM